MDIGICVLLEQFGMSLHGVVQFYLGHVTFAGEGFAIAVGL